MLLLLVACPKNTETVNQAGQQPESEDSSEYSFSDGMNSMDAEEKEMNGNQLDGVDSGLSEVENS